MLVSAPTMFPPLDVFSIKDDEPLWLGPAETLVQALEIARQAGAGSYLIFSEKTGHKARYEVDARGSIKLMDKAEPEDA